MLRCEPSAPSGLVWEHCLAVSTIVLDLGMDPILIVSCFVLDLGTRNVLSISTALAILLLSQRIVSTTTLLLSLLAVCSATFLSREYTKTNLAQLITHASTPYDVVSRPLLLSASASSICAALGSQARSLLTAKTVLHQSLCFPVVPLPCSEYIVFISLFISSDNSRRGIG